MTEREDLAWELVLATSDGVTRTPNRRDPYEAQAEAFLDAVEAGDPGRVLATYRDALATDRLTRSVVAAAGVAG
jgi:predicted dehydrogenase